MQEWVMDLYRAAIIPVVLDELNKALLGQDRVRSVEERVVQKDVGDVCVILIYGGMKRGDATMRSMLRSGRIPPEYPMYAIFCNKTTGHVECRRGSEFNDYYSILDEDLDSLKNI